MILTSKARYGVIAMVDLALQTSARPINLNDISQRQQIALKYLEQIFNKLKQKKLVKATRGPGGGYSLQNSPNQITILSIVEALEEKIKMTQCTSAEKFCLNSKFKCLTHDLWEGLSKQIYAYLDAISLQDLCEKKILL